MKRLEVALAALVFLGIALAVRLGRPAPPDASLFGSDIALAPELAPLALPLGALELRGSVRTAAGAPADDAFVVLLRAEDDASEAEPLVHAYTDGEGRFALAGLTAGSYRVVLTHPSATPARLEIVLPANGEVSWQLGEPLPPLPVLPDLRRTELAGRVRLPEGLAEPGTSLEGFEVVLVPAAGTPPLTGACERRASTDGEGRFSLAALVAARYDVQVLPPWARGGSWPIVARGTTAAEEGVAGTLELALEVGVLEGELREAEGRPLVGALIKVAALDARDPVGQPQLWPPVVTDPAGRFQVELLPPGRYLVHVRAGSAASDAEVVVEAGRRASVPLGTIDPRSGEGAPSATGG